MPKPGYDRYALLKNNDGTVNSMPFVPIPERPSDKYEYWNIGFSRLDKIANMYYDNPFYDFLILNANPQYRSQFDIPDNAVIRIPFPLLQAINDFESKLIEIKNK
jgi:hypothetical protein